MSVFDPARAVANAVLYEGYLLYPYTASARKNQQRWQFGVIMPPAFEDGSNETSSMQTELLVQAPGNFSLVVALRFLHLQRRTVEDATHEVAALQVDGVEHIPWDEAVEREILVASMTCGPQALVHDQPFTIPALRTEESLRDARGDEFGKIVRTLDEISGTIHIRCEPCGDFYKLHVGIRNESALMQAGSNDRQLALRTALISAHTLLAVSGGRFISAFDPPPGAAAALKQCSSVRTWPVLIGADADDKTSAAIMLSSPIILYDYAQIAAESEGDKFDATEIDELLNLSVLAMTDEEKRQARATDDRARLIIDRADAMAPEHFAKLHGALRYLESVGQKSASGNGGNGEAGGNDNGNANGSGDGNAGGFSPFDDVVPGAGHVMVAGKKIETGSRVRLRPVRKADVWDTFLEGKTAKVAGVYEDLESQKYVAVTVDDDPASDMHDWYGRYMYFFPNEIEPLEDDR
ncbi:MAG: hypothetical protein M3007_08710 [Candidatus Eremiobacteraeota bacterium]|nr:hypothetical protein [Candidatus Eremiobacteraeota bacterium]